VFESVCKVMPQLRRPCNVSIADKSMSLTDKSRVQPRDRLSQECQAEIENLRLVPLGDEDIGRLDVAMDDALGTRRVEPISI